MCFADSREKAAGIYIIAKGRVELCLPVKQGGKALRVLKRGSVRRLVSDPKCFMLYPPAGGRGLRVLGHAVAVARWSWTSLTQRVRRRDVIGSDAVIGDDRWAGAWGVRADFIAKTVCSAIFLPSEDVHVRRAPVAPRAFPSIRESPPLAFSTHPPAFHDPTLARSLAH